MILVLMDLQTLYICSWLTLTLCLPDAVRFRAFAWGKQSEMVAVCVARGCSAPLLLLLTREASSTPITLRTTWSRRLQRKLGLHTHIHTAGTAIICHPSELSTFYLEFCESKGECPGVPLSWFQGLWQNLAEVKWKRDVAAHIIKHTQFGTPDLFPLLFMISKMPNKPHSPRTMKISFVEKLGGWWERQITGWHCKVWRFRYGCKFMYKELLLILANRTKS